ncbi:MAG: helix-turn-helix domain-containing protein [Trebonia sp.]
MTDVAERPTLAEIKTWPPTVDVPTAALALGVSRSTLYEAVRSGRCPVEFVMVGRRTRILTAALVRTLEGSTAVATALGE